MNQHVTIRKQGFNSKAPEGVLKPSTFKARVIDLPVLNVSLLDLARNGCRYATTAESPHLFCGMPQQQGSAYCCGHNRLCHTRPSGHSDEMKAATAARYRRRSRPMVTTLMEASV